MSGKHLGKAYIKMDGTILETMPGATLDVGGDERSMLVGSNAVLGYTEKPHAAMLDCKIAVGPTTDIDAFRNAINVTITFECDTGQVFNMPNAVSLLPPVVADGDGGHLPLKFGAARADAV